MPSKIENLWTFALEKRDWDYIKERGETHRIFHFPLDITPYMVIVGYRNVLDKIRESEGIKNAISAGLNILSIAIDNEIDKIRDATLKDDVHIWHFKELNLAVAIIKKELMPDDIKINGIGE
jgi:hypothetical protein